MYEVECKVEITEEERARLITLFSSKDFLDKGTVTQNDFHIEFTKSPFGGHDFKRYRNEGEKCFYTEKINEEINGRKARREIEKEVSREELLAETAKYPNAVEIKKDRQMYLGKYQNKEINIDMDSVKFDHSPSMRYFIEAEIMTEDKEEVQSLRQLVKEFLKNSLGKKEIIESPGMLTMASEKL